MSEADTPERTLGERTAAAAAWALTGRGLSQVVGFALSIALLSMILPADRGLVGMVMVFVYILSDVRDLRFSDALIQRKELGEAHRRSAFCVHAGAGLFLSLILIAAAPAVARFYDEPKLFWLTIALGLKPFLDSLADVSLALLVRRMEFRKIALADIAALTSSGVLAIVLAAKGLGPWALVALSLGGSLVKSGVVLASAGWIPVPGLSLVRLRDLWRFSSYLYGARLLGQFSRNGDKLLVGKFLGSIALGLYGLGFQLMMMPLEQISWVVGRVMFAALSEIQDDLERFRNAYLRAVRLLSLITFPVTIGLCVTAAELVHAIARPEWADGIRVIRIFCVVGFFESISTTVGWIFFSRGRTRREFAWTAVQLGATLTAVLVGLRFGIAGVAIAYLARTLVLLIPSFVVAFRLIGLRLGVLLRWLAPTAGAAGIMAVAVLGLRAALSAYVSWPAWAMLIAEVVCGVAVYTACIRVGASEVWAEALAAWRRLVQERRAAP